MSRAKRSAQRRRIAVLLLVVTAGLALPACSRPDVLRPSAVGSEPQPALELLESDLTYYDEDGRPLWQLRARSMRYFEPLKETHAEDVELQFYEPGGRETLIVTAEQLIFEHRSGGLMLRGKLRARDPDGELKFVTEEARWDAQGRELRGDAPVEVVREDERGTVEMRGRGFSYRPDEGTLTLRQAELKLRLPVAPSDGR
jgi:LPS export ABC transporter protein LptC